MKTNIFSKILLTLAFFFIISLSASGQEICNNGIDDDGDGFVDCFDNECLNAVNCSDDFIGDQPICEVPPTAFPTFSLKLQSSSPNGTASGNGMVSIGDVDSDGFPEIVTVNYYSDSIFVLDGRTSAIKYERALPVRPHLEVMIADIDGDGCAEIFFPYKKRSNNGFGDYGIMALNCDLSSILWSQTTLYRAGNIGVADFDGDGLSELYAKDEIFDAHTGTKLHASNYSNDPDDNNFIDKRIVAGGVAVDILSFADCGANCDGQELVLGGLIFSVNINRGSNSATLNLEKSIDYRPVYYSPWEQNRTSTSVADYNLDGFLDVIVPGKTSSSSSTRIFFWDVKNNVIQNYRDNVDNWPIGAGRPNIADIDGDGQLNITFVSGPFLYALNEDMSLKWKKAIIENTSGTTGTTVFDFNGDGEYETVYRDENFLYIVNGNNGDFYTSVPCRSLTYSEYPIVADVNGDGATEICVTCLTSNAGDISDDIDEAQVRVYESQDDQWVAARKVWNQHAYFNVNVNDNLTIPREPQKHHLVFSSGVCGAGDTRPLNSFLNQSPFITNQGCPNYAASDLNFAGNIVLNTPQCPDTDFAISFDMSNDGDKDVTADIPFTFYDGDPRTAVATKLNTVTQALSIPAGSTITVNATVMGPGTNFVLYIAINHDGVTPPPITYPSGGVIECVYDNNIGSIPIDPTPFPVSAAKVSDNDKCLVTAPDNGEARAYVLIGAAEVTTGYTFNWYNTTPPAGPVDFTGVNYANLAAGTYSVTAFNNDKSCAGDTTSVIIGESFAAPPTVTISNENPFSDCNNPNGQLRATVNGGEPSSNFTFEWYIGNNVFIPSALVSISDVASNLDPQLYTVVVVEIATGCQVIENETVPLSVDFPVVSATVTSEFTVCGATGNGSATANVAGITAGFTFNWYNGSVLKPTADHTGITYSNLSAGSYLVTATNNSTGCTSDPVAVTIQNLASQPTVSAQVDTDQTACGVGIFNGSVSANVAGTTTGFTFNWYQGQTTADAFEVVGSPSATITGLAAGIYTVKATDDVSGCFDTEEVTIINSPTVSPVVTPTAVTAQSICTTGAENGEVSASVAGATAGFTFYWFNGDQTSGTPDLNNPDNDPTVLSGITYTGLAAGDYTVVAVNNSTECASNPVKIAVVDNTTVTTPVIATTLIHQTSCDATDPNGSINASVTAGGVDADFDFQIFVGQNTLEVNKATLLPEATVTGLTFGIYTVLATHKVTGCFTSTEVTLNNMVVLPTISAVPTSVNLCDPADGFITASIDIGNVTDYTFKWYDGTSVKAVPDYAEESNVLSNLSEGTYTVEAFNNSTNCNTQNTQTIILVNDPSAAITITTNTGETIIPSDCDDNSGQLGVSASSPGNVSGFTFSWFSGDVNSGMTFITNGNDLNSPTTTNRTDPTLLSGRYTVIAQDNDTGCQDSLVIDLPFNDIHTLQNTLIDNNTNCSLVNGSFTTLITASEAVRNLMGTGTDTDQSWYRLDLFRNGIMVESKVGGDGNTATVTITPTLFENLESGDYTVIAVEINGALPNGCSSIPENITIGDDAIEPVITLSSKLDNTNCPDPDPLVNNGNGSISLTIDNTTPPAIGDYSYIWHEGKLTSDPVLPAVNTPDGHTAINLKGGFYTVEVTNTTNDCPTVATFNIIDNPPVVSISTVLVTPNVNCNPDTGTAAVTALSFGVPGDYTYQWLQSDGVTPIAGAGDTATPPVSLNGGIPGGSGIDYFVIATHGVNSCVSSSVQFTIINTANNPVINATTIAENTICSPNANGEIIIEIDDGNSATDYTISWLNDSTSSGVPVPASNIDSDGLRIFNVTSGNYTVTVTDNNPANEGCAASATFFVPDNPAILSILVPDDLTLAPNDKCIAPYTGSAEILFVRENGTQMSAAGYTFQWFDANMDIVLGSDNGSILTGLSSGSYFVIATNNTTGCSNLPATGFEIEDFTAPPVIRLVDFFNPTQCNGPGSEGLLSVSADNSTSTTDYTFSWFDESMNAILNNDSPPIPVNSGQIFDLTAQSYTVEVTNNISGCMSSETFTLVDVVAPIIVATSSSPVTECNRDNGSVFAKVISTPSTYTYLWYAGNQSAPNLNNPAFTGQEWVDRPAGEYTVVAIDQNDATCISNPFTITVDSEQIFPEIQISEDAALINCDPTRPNGQLSANVNGSVSGYTFEWFNGTDTSEIPDNIGATYGQLTSNIDYTVRVTNVITGCFSELSQTVSENFPIIFTPEVTLVSNMNNCISPNGSLSATVDGSVDGYNFEWYIGTNTSTTPIGREALIGGLDVGQYTVRAIDIATGCFVTASGEIIDERVFPEFDIRVSNSSCQQSNGSIQITAKPGSLVDSIVWILPESPLITTPSPYSSLALEGFPQGRYEFTVYGPGGCGVPGEIDIIDEIIIYNGISTNGDEQNDHFIIECIENFENNTVKIYNRTGQIVYEANHYGEGTTLFTGEGNKGIYLSGNEVPEGTYFYIVDKGDGSEPKTGYLELTR